VDDRDYGVEGRYDQPDPLADQYDWRAAEGPHGR
jgi:hypothetical protein